MTKEPTILIPYQGAHEANRIRCALIKQFPEINLDLQVTETPETSHCEIATADIVLTAGLTTEQLSRAENLEWVQALNAGVDSYPLAELQERGVVLTNASGVHAEPIGEQVLGYLLVFERGIDNGIRQHRKKTQGLHQTGELWDDTLGIVGVGAIGTRVAELGKALDMTVLGVKRDLSAVTDAVDEVVTPDRLNEVLKRSNYLVIACPLTDETRGLIGANELATMKSSAVVVNIARGEIIDQPALVDALRSGTIGGAALDVFEEEPLPEDSPLRALPNVLVTPHMAGSTPYYMHRAVEIFMTNYHAYLEDDIESFINRIH